jgi:light-regulated signal transduction histidine kinase (bacteriophytochrome)
VRTSDQDYTTLLNSRCNLPIGRSERNSSTSLSNCTVFECYENSLARLPKLTKNRVQLTRIFSDVISNAIDRSHPYRQTNISIDRFGDRYTIEISDRDDVIYLADSPFLFERFCKAKNRLKELNLRLHLSQ